MIGVVGLFDCLCLMILLGIGKRVSNPSGALNPDISLPQKEAPIEG